MSWLSCDINKEVGWKGVDCIHLAQNKDRQWPVACAVRSTHTPSMAEYFIATASFSKRACSGGIIQSALSLFLS